MLLDPSRSVDEKRQQLAEDISRIQVNGEESKTALARDCSLDLASEFHSTVVRTATHDGVYPHILLYTRVTNVNALCMDVLAVNKGLDVYRHASDVLKGPPDVHQLVFGLDRKTKPEQGTRYNDCLPFLYIRFMEKPRVGVINYRVDADNGVHVDEDIDWHNHFWKQAIKKEWAQVCLFGLGLTLRRDERHKSTTDDDDDDERSGNGHHEK